MTMGATGVAQMYLWLSSAKMYLWHPSGMGGRRRTEMTIGQGGICQGQETVPDCSEAAEITRGKREWHLNWALKDGLSTLYVWHL